jgi:alpha-tubulin suppressor-like RCC1 family protein
MSRTLIIFGLQLLWLVPACGSGGFDSHRDPTVQGPGRLIFTMPPTAVIAGVVMRPVAVTVLDEHGNLMTGARINVTLALGINPRGGTLLGTITQPAVDGVATFYDLSLDTSGFGYTLVATATAPRPPDGSVGGTGPVVGFGPATSSPFDVTFAPARLLFVVQPSSAAPGEAIGPSVRVAVMDVQGAIVVTANMAVTLAIETNPTGGSLRGNTTAPVVNGTATFPNLFIDKPGRGYTLTASGIGETGDAGQGIVSPATSVPFNVGGFVAISAGANACGVDLAGTAYCWTGGSLSPQLVPMSGGLTFADVTVGSLVGCGVTNVGAAYCWGDGFSTTPVAMSGGLTFAAVNGNCGVTTTGAAYCWGDNDWGQLGNGSSARSETPVPVAGGLKFASVTAGVWSNCGVTTAGAAYCWGYNVEGQFDDGWGDLWSNKPIAVPGGLTFSTVSDGAYHRCGVTTAGAAYCWGYNGHGQLGNGSMTTSSTPVAVGGGLRFVSVSVSGEHSCGVTTAGVAYCWGSNLHGELGDGSSKSSSTPVLVAGGLTFANVSAGSDGSDGYGPDYSCAMTTAGEAYCWGSNVHGELGDGSTIDSSTPVAVAGGLTFASVSAGAGRTCGVTTGGAAYCWGNNSTAVLGNGSTIDSSTPVAVAGGLTFASVSAEGSHSSCGVTTSGAAYCWGSIPSSSPIRVADEITFEALSSGGGHSCGVTAAGVAYCWGQNGSGQLGNGSTTNSSTPVAVAGSLIFANVSAGDSHSCGVTTAGTAYCWGLNGGGQLGNGTTLSSSTPVAVAGRLIFADVNAGGSHTCGVTTAGTAYCWGANYYGQLGNGSATDSTRPVAVDGGLAFASVGAGAAHSCGVTTAGPAYCWGYNSHGELGTGSFTYVSNTPVPVVGGLTFASVSAGDWRSCGLGTTGAAYCWGAGDSTVPVRVPTP